MLRDMDHSEMLIVVDNKCVNCINVNMIVNNNMLQETDISTILDHSDIDTIVSLYYLLVLQPFHRWHWFTRHLTFQH